MNQKIALILSLFHSVLSLAQTAYTGDLRGGRLWYRPTNFSVGSYSAHAVCGEERQLYSWGTNRHGELGYNYWENQYKPIKVTGMDSVYYYSAGYIAGAIKLNGSGYVWGRAFKSPTHVIDNAKYIDAGEQAVTFVKEDGTVWSVGYDIKGTFGTGVLNQNHKLYRSPQKMVGIDNAIRVANGYRVTLVLTDKGEVYGSGWNNDNGLSPDWPYIAVYPQKIQGLENIVAIASARFVHIALDHNGDVFMWGRGDGNWSGRLRKMEGLENVVAISARNDGKHFMALDNEGNVYSWGGNYYYQLGTSNRTSYNEPQLVFKDAVDILAGESFSYIVKRDMSLWACGSNNGGSIWLTRNHYYTSEFTQIYWDSSLNICRPYYVDFPNLTVYNFEKCEQGVVSFQSKEYSEEGIYVDSFLNRFGQDSFSVVMIKDIVPVVDSFEHEICHGERISFGGRSITQAGWYVDSAVDVYGCDSVSVLLLHVLDVSSENFTQEICSGEQFRFHNRWVDSTSVYYDTFKNVLGCDSVVSLELTVLDKSYTLIEQSICEGDSVSFGDKVVRYPGSYYDTLVNYLGCDSIVELQLEIIAPKYFSQEFFVCPGQLVHVGSRTYSMAGNYIDTLESHMHCDSIVSTKIHNANSFQFEEQHVVCAGDFVKSHGEVLESAMTHVVQFETVYGCDSTYIIAIDTFKDHRCHQIKVYIGNAFTPNGDGLNDEFGFTGLHIKEAELLIATRWGEILYHEVSTMPRWDGMYLGKECHQDVYVFYLKAFGYQDEILEYHGTVTLLR